jgi:hypothetical protein
MGPKDRLMRGDLPYRIRLGMAGSREPATPEAARALVQGELPRAIAQLFDADSRAALSRVRHTPIAYTLVTSLEGPGDRALARAVRELPAGRVEVVTPGPRSAWLHSLPEGVRAEAEALLAGDRLPAELAPGAGAEALPNWIVDRADVVLEPGGRGLNRLGTLARGHARPVIRLPGDEGGTLELEHGLGLNADPITRLDRFNAAGLPAATVERLVEDGYRRMFDTPEGGAVPEPLRELVRSGLLPAWARATLLADRHKRLYQWAGQLVWTLFPIAVAAVALGSLVPATAPVAFPAQAVLLLLMLGVVWLADRSRSLDRWVECRLLGERLSSAAYLAACGMEAAPAEVPPYQGRRVRGEWMAKAFAEVWDRLPPLPGFPAEGNTTLEGFVRTAWIAQQRRFHAQRAATTARTSRLLERTGQVVFALAVVAALAHTAFAYHLLHSDPAEHLLVFIGLVLPGLGAALGGYRAHREYSRIAKRSGAMAAALGEVERQVADSAARGELPAAIREVERLMVSEVRDWLALMRAATVEAVG